MAPISFYPAVDNPEYFHVPSGNPSNEVEERGKVKPSVPPRKPSTGNSLREDNALKLNNIGSRQQNTSTDSESDSAPEVPPRSENSDCLYVNTYSNETAQTGFIGDYLYTKAEQSPRVCENRLSSGSTTVVSPEGATSVHNILYTSNIPSKSPRNSGVSFGSVSPQSFSNSWNSQTYSSSKNQTISMHSSSSSNGVGTYASMMSESYQTPSSASTSDVPLTPAPPVPSPTVKDHFVFDVPSGHYDSLKRKKMAIEAREKEEKEAMAEKVRLDEILAICAEYHKQNSDPGNKAVSPTKQTSPYHTLPQNRIKTNGSLSRDKRSPPYSGSASVMSLSPPLTSQGMHRAITPSEDELTSIFNHGSSQTLDIISKASFPSYSITSTSLARSPYENVSPQLQSSPRSKIRTTFKGKENSEVIENKMALYDARNNNSYEIMSNTRLVASDFATFNKIAKDADPLRKVMSSSHSLSPSTIDSGFPSKRLESCHTLPLKPSRTPRIDHSPMSPFGATYQNDNFCHLNSNKYFDENKRKEALAAYDTPKWPIPKAVPSVHYSSPSSLPVHHTNSLESKIKNKVFVEHMIKNLQDSFNVQDVPEEIKRLKEEKQVAMECHAEFRRKIDELERQENEFLRELDIERALLEAELASTRKQLAEDSTDLDSLRRHSDDMDVRHMSEKKADQQYIEECKERLEKAEEALEKMDWKSESFQGTTDEETEMLEALKSQHESVEAERKIYEDTEFGQMEGEAHRESEREELFKEINEIIQRINNHKTKIEELEVQMTTMTASVCKETEALENQRQLLISKINKERMHLAALDRQFGYLEKMGMISNGHISPCSSESDESCNKELAEKLAKLHLLDRSQEDLELINQVTTSSPLEYKDTSLGRKTSDTLQEIEKNRQLVLAKQGSLVIDSERKRVEELKQRVADEVKAQWEERKAREQREVNCTSLNSVGSEESSITSSDMQTESLSSEEAARANGFSKTTIMLRQREKDAPSDESVRPVSDASSYYDTDGSTVKLRKEKSRTQRPLTRYLPVRPEVQFDLRQHIESSGHQLDQCHYLTVTASICRGCLYKLGSTFKAWQKRWFVFDRSKRALIYYSDKTEAKPRGGTCFEEIEEVYVDHRYNGKNSQQSLTFCVKTPKRTYHLMARSPEAMRIWIDVIFTGAEGYREFPSGS